ncbi:MAG: RIP metalloprotease RseP [Polaribacter sp.]
MEILIKASQFILSLSLLIVLHELGHFIPAKLFKTRVEKFYLFFDYKISLFKKKIGETVYGIGWIPLGGYVKISGMIDESMDTEQMALPPKPWEFRSKPAWQRLIIMLGGVTVNFLLGWFLYIAITVFWGRELVNPEGIKNGFAVAENFKKYGFEDGDKILKIDGKTPDNVTNVNKFLFLRGISSIDILHTNGNKQNIKIPNDVGSIMWKSGVMNPFKPRILKPVVDSVIPNDLADKAGILTGDKIIAVNSQYLEYWEEFTNKIQFSKDSVSITIDRNGALKNVTIRFEKDKKKKIGVTPKIDKKAYKKAINSYHKDFNFSESITKGSSLAYWTLKDYISQFKYVFTAKGAQSLGGFISIGKIFPSTWSWKAFWSITAFLSIMLGFMNLLPIPALDGGHVVFTLWEMITGKKPGDKFLEYAQIVGFVLLIALLLFANGNDVYRWIKGL